ncbi:NADH dehydrogenase (ubiquinone) flavoprotein 3-like, isoform CRA_b [Rattus norvegicus]|uniref:NADH dehydrogenase [ubiquinone] flavoprotein 3, mitochondrial n=3 Tax=Rattus norvegicus TaxID=10116 RepID=NDUV3_RAT|nr:NADH dehydrogenase [ubiquinone] flavoprotein 3, mitochondrial isoform 2 [Rattus norvegicus]Q6PCU8.1 RecName: Full=NADH dehydrogenase [ubiquinone] flavoprotein 3, mitochondrial; AltName: Full=Complex I-9kD; Short=CI-9kD; AltName: Full=NADH-ubiquinone oxidoreductase 9 kDa subunit; Flags: Precursor [Rattus norvegicus]AAH59134.1 Ndufv3 protein [Rattus norvegicus]EDL97016.1 NADH dehydrogenase (ubiquinone) flavoprotein 3-like, isoform CRA_b [Rattus norvegicus]|eukprot:NP_001094481.1 NADH dehydrogenase [ubiquinone] flavoprotein 3, mitochondrial isoform 2 [Rattus norvegicus]
MAVSLLLRGGRIRALKAALLEAKVFRGELASTVPLSTESENNKKAAGPTSKTESVFKEPTLVPESSDTTTYKNLQHHEYNAFTFLDLNLDLSKFRLPQPSSGRESPRH